MTRLASIGIGTNTIRLLIAIVEKKEIKEILCREEVMIRLGEGLSVTGKISEEAIQRCVATLSNFQDMVRNTKAHITVVSATSATRDARNQQAFLETIQQKNGLKVDVISGHEEARRVHLGVIGYYQSTNSNSLAIVDIGGGSTELIMDYHLGDEIARASINIGSRRLTDMFLEHDPPKAEEYNTMLNHIQQKISIGFPDFLNPVERLVGVGGTATTITAIHVQRDMQPASRIEGHKLLVSFIENLMEELASKSLIERKQIPGLPKERASVILAGTAIMQLVMRALNCRSVIVTERGLLEGNLLAKLK